MAVAGTAVTLNVDNTAMTEGDTFPSDGIPRTQTGPLLVSSNSGAFQLMQYVISQSGPPSMSVVIAVEQYQTSYTISVHASVTRAYILLIAPAGSTDDLYLDDKVKDNPFVFDISFARLSYLIEYVIMAVVILRWPPMPVHGQLWPEAPS